jgi:hypothetical protein
VLRAGANGGILAHIRENKMELPGNRGWPIHVNIPGGLLRFNRVCESLFAPRRSERFSAGNFRLNCFFILAAICLLAPQVAHSQETESPVTAKSQGKRPVESELIVEGLASYGHYKIFASGSGCKLYTGGVEYDRHSWGYFLKARVDYVAEVLPLILLDEAATSDIWGTPTTSARQVVPGLGFSPIGFRMQWWSNKAIKPYLEAKGGLLAFPKKVLSQNATYESFSLQSAMGMQVKMNERWGLRLGLFSDFHFSDGFTVPVNPGLDVMNANLGLSYHFGK